MMTWPHTLDCASAGGAEDECDCVTRIEERCICQHEPHDGPCPERVMTGFSGTGMTGTMPCGCDDYLP